MTEVQSPEKELRFTRAGQAVGFWLAAAVMAAVAVWVASVSVERSLHPDLPHPAWVLLPLGLAVGLGRMAVRLTKHAYVILTPLGIEIFPFFRPTHGMRLVIWQEVAAADVDETGSMLTLHHNVEKTSGIHLSLRPIRADRRTLLVEAVMRRLVGTEIGN